ncbi:unnamed protein product [Amoebophrya sp. A120]|nr:unnamed protein product [Amoebophrya sp. A120]|eukprot:GSA120T00024775001.1
MPVAPAVVVPAELTVVIVPPELLLVVVLLLPSARREAQKHAAGRIRGVFPGNVCDPVRQNDFHCALYLFQGEVAGNFHQDRRQLVGLEVLEQGLQQVQAVPLGNRDVLDFLAQLLVCDQVTQEVIRAHVEVGVLQPVRELFAVLSRVDRFLQSSQELVDAGDRDVTDFRKQIRYLDVLLELV